jgi:hypothetical protein
VLGPGHRDHSSVVLGASFTRSMAGVPVALNRGLRVASASGTSSPFRGTLPPESRRSSARWAVEWTQNADPMSRKMVHGIVWEVAASTPGIPLQHHDTRG